MPRGIDPRREGNVGGLFVVEDEAAFRVEQEAVFADRACRTLDEARPTGLAALEHLRLAPFVSFEGNGGEEREQVMKISHARDVGDVVPAVLRQPAADGKRL